MSAIDTSPASIDVGSLEKYPLAIDMTAYLGSGDTVSNASATLTDMSTETAYPAGIVSTITTGNIVTVTLIALTALHSYVLVVSFVASTGKTLETRTIINCPA